MEARPNDATVAELLAMVRGMLDDERTRGQGLDGKSATLAGFTGTILALTRRSARSCSTSTSAASARRSSSASMSSRCMALGFAALVALIGVLRPQPRLALAMDEIRRFSEFPLIAQPLVEVQGTMMNTLIEALAHERALNERKARLTRVAAVGLAVGFARWPPRRSRWALRPDARPVRGSRPCRAATPSRPLPHRLHLGSGSPFGRFLTSPVLLVGLVALAVGFATFSYVGDGRRGGRQRGGQRVAGFAGSWESRARRRTPAGSR